MSRSPVAIFGNRRSGRVNPDLSVIAGPHYESSATSVRDAERRFPVRVRVAVPPEGFDSRLDEIIAWLDANYGADKWTSTPSSTRGVVNDALAVYFLDATIANAFVARILFTELLSERKNPSESDDP
jgi:hypothetical protein